MKSDDLGFLKFDQKFEINLLRDIYNDQLLTKYTIIMRMIKQMEFKQPD